MKWPDLIASLGTYVDMPTEAFASCVLRAVDFAEQRLYRELDLLSTRITDATGTLTANQRLFTFPTDLGAFIVVEQLTPFVGGVRQPTLLPVSREYIDSVYPSDTPPSTPSVPAFFCMRDNATALVAPAPDFGYTIETVGTIRPAPLSPTNPSTFLATTLPDAFFALAMSFFTVDQKAPAAPGAPAPPVGGWEQHAMTLVKSANVEEARKKFQSGGWSTRLPSPIATPPQT